MEHLLRTQNPAIMKALVDNVRKLEQDHERLAVADNSNDFLMNMSHEFKTPLSAIQLNAQLMEKVVENKSAELLKFLSKYIERIVTESKSVVNILEDTISFMRLGNNPPELDFSIFNGTDVLNELTILYGNYYPHKKFTVHNNSVSSFFIDRSTFMKALNRLVEIILEVDNTHRPDFSIRQTSKKLVMEFEAPGLRIKRSEMKSIFNPFSSLSEFNQVEALPLRLGLIKQLLYLNKATINIDIADDNSVKFIVRVPKYVPQFQNAA